MIFPAIRHSQRAVAQAGWHTLHSFRGLNEDGLTAEPMNCLKDDSERLSVLGIEAQSAKKLRIELRDMGIHSATVHCDLASVCREIERDFGEPHSVKRELRNEDHR